MTIYLIIGAIIALLSVVNDYYGEKKLNQYSGAIVFLTIVIITTLWPFMIAVALYQYFIEDKK
jgi:D-alanyl-lipoteichoic acid acyltransferase DltB (MBOAT superfamily)